MCYRMDKDQCARRNLREQDPSFHDPDYYEFESQCIYLVSIRTKRKIIIVEIIDLAE